MAKKPLIKAIDTEYNGMMFRSRLEARWAVFFDAAKIKYEYEPEGFEHDGIRYLPDFYLPDFDTFAEVKPDRDGAEKDLLKYRRLIYWGGPIKRLIFLGNIPGPCNGGGWCFPCLYYDASDNDGDCIKSGWWSFFNMIDLDPNTGDVYASEDTKGCILHTNYRKPFGFTTDCKHAFGLMTNQFDANTGHMIYEDLSFRPRSDYELDERHKYSKDELDHFEKEENPALCKAYKAARTSRFEFKRTK